jgi:hypothetical protein
MNQIVNVTANQQLGAISSVFANVKTEGDLSGGITGGYGLMKFKGKVWSIQYKGATTALMRDDGDGPRNSIEVVILKANPHLSKIWYENGYVEGSDAPPDCSAASGIQPDQGVPKPQSTFCANCPKNAWGTAANGGKGKACGDSRRLAIVPLPDIKNEALGGPLLLRVPAASLQDLAAFDQKYSQQGYPYFAIGVRIAFDPAESFPKFQFTAVRPLNDQEAMLVMQMRNSDEVARVISEAPAAMAPQVTQQAATTQLFEQPAPVAAPAPVVAPAAPVAAAPSNLAPAGSVAPQAAIQQTGFGPAAATVAAEPSIAPQPVAAAPTTAPVQAAAPVVEASPTPAQPVALTRAMTGFGPGAVEAPVQAQQATKEPAQAFAGAVDGTVEQPQGAAVSATNAQFDDSVAGLDDKLKALLG